MARFGTRIAATLAALAALGGCSSGRTVEASFQVVASFYPVAEAARQIGGSSITVRDLTPLGAEPHDLELRPSDLTRLRTADLILYFDRGFQPSVEDAVDALPDAARAVDLLDGLRLRPAEADGETADPHVWLDPGLMISIVDRVADEMGERLPAEREAFADRAAAYTRTLQDLDGRFAGTLATCTRKELVTSHAAFGYLAARYGLKQIAISGISPEAEPSPRRLEEVSTFARAHAVTTIFFETLVSPRVAQTIARSVGAATAVLNPIEGLTSEQHAAGEHYVSLMDENLDALAKGLECERRR